MDSVGHVKINREGDQFSVTFAKDRKRKFSSFDKLLQYAIVDNDMMKTPIISETELEESLSGPADGDDTPELTVR